MHSPPPGTHTPATLERLAAGTVMIGFPGRTVPTGARQLIARGVRGFVLFARNIDDGPQVRALTAELRALAGNDALIAIDHEGGRVNRLQGVATPWPAPMAWAATGAVDLVRDASEVAARELAALGINLNFAPVADLLADHHNPVLGSRCFSDDPVTAAAYTSAFVEGHRRASVAATAKHFPGHGGTSVDSHVDLPRVDRTLDEMRLTDLIPFQAAMTAGVDCLMIGHVWYARVDERETPGTLSAGVARIARDDCGYRGVIVTDCLEMGAIETRTTTGEAAVAAIQAGADLVLVSHRHDRQQEAIEALTAAALRGTLAVERLEEANARLDGLRRRVCVAAAPPPRGGLDLARSIAHRSVTLVRDRHATLPLALSPDTPLGVVTFSARSATGVENPETTSSRLADAVRHYHPRVVDVTPVAGSEQNTVLRDLHAVDTVLVGTFFATGRPIQGEVVEALLRAGKRVVVLALGDPFDVLSFPDAPCYVTAYGDGLVEIDAALSVLFGKTRAQGRLPVALPGLYPRGHPHAGEP
ncbi:MAG: beta-N-acetylhexosaminidase [Chloroflexota bacterium]